MEILDRIAFEPSTLPDERQAELRRGRARPGLAANGNGA